MGSSFALGSQRDLSRSHCFAELTIYHGALVHAQCADAVASAQEREILGHDPIQQR